MVKGPQEAFMGQLILKCQLLIYKVHLWNSKDKVMKSNSTAVDLNLQNSVTGP